MRNLKIILLILIFLFVFNLSSFGQEDKNFAIGIKIHGHIEPMFSISWNNNNLNLTIKLGTIFDNGTLVVVPAIFLGYSIEKFQPYVGIEGFFTNQESKYLILFRLGNAYRININNLNFKIGGEVGIPLNYNFRLVPTLTFSYNF